MNAENPITPEPKKQDNPVGSSPKKIFSHKRKTLFIALFVVLVATTLFSGYRLHARYAKHISGSQECISLAKKIEGTKFSGVYSLSCTLTPRKIANSTLTAQYLEYSGAPKDKGICFDAGALLPPAEGSKYCVSFTGTMVSNGKIYPGVGAKAIVTLLNYDYCYSTRLILPTRLKPSSQDLYFYRGTLYDRDTFNNTQYKTPYGTCVLNGTTLYQTNKTNGNYITNVKIDYIGFPKDCKTVMIGRPADDSLDCATLVTAANASLGACYSSDTPIVVNGKITGYQTEYQAYVGQTKNGDCEDAYVQRMAALDQCQYIANATLKSSCEPKVSQPSYGVQRVNSTL